MHPAGRFSQYNDNEGEGVKGPRLDGLEDPELPELLEDDEPLDPEALELPEDELFEDAPLDEDELPLGVTGTPPQAEITSDSAKVTLNTPVRLR